MASISSPGIGSGLDVNSIVSQLVAAERAAPDKRLATAQSRAQLQISALGAFNSVLSNLQNAAKALAPTGLTASSFGQLAATASDTTLFSATATNKAVPGSYNVEVVSLAVASKIASPLYAASTTVIGTGNVTLTVAGKAFTVALASPANTLADLRDQINAAPDNSGVSAAIVNDSGGARLLLTSKSTGVANAVTLSSSLFSTTGVQAAADASVKIDGFTFTGSSNQVTGAIDGVTLNLTKQAPGTVAKLTVGLDQTAATGAVQAFVTAYNAALSTINQLTRYDPATRTSGPLLSDATAQSALQQLRNILSQTVTGAGTYTTLSQIGITTGKDGTLLIDSTKLGTALTTDFSSVKKLFSDSTSGIAQKISDYAGSLIASNGPIKARTDGATSQLKDLSRQQDALNRRIQSYQIRTFTQFSKLDSLLSSLKSTGDYLTQQLARL